MTGRFRKYLNNINCLTSIHYVYLSDYPVQLLTEKKELAILKWIQNPVIFVMRCPVSLHHVHELLSVGNGITFDYERKQVDLAAKIAIHTGKSYVSPGVRAFIKPDIDSLKRSSLPVFMPASQQNQPTNDRDSQSVTQILLKNYSSRRSRLSVS